MKTASQQWHGATGEWVKFLQSDGASQNTVRARRYQMYLIAASVRKGPWRVTESDLRGFFAGHDDWSPGTRRKYVSALRSFFGWAHARGYVKRNPAGSLVQSRLVQYRPRPIPEDVLAAALARTKGTRLHLMLLLGAQLGMRRTEIAAAHTDAVVPHGSGFALRFIGKGNRERTQPLTPDVVAAIRALPRGWCFPNGRGGHLTGDRVTRLLSAELAPYTAHQLRHRFGTVVYRKSKDILLTRDLLGHTSVNTTQVYALPDPDEAMRGLAGWVA